MNTESLILSEINAKGVGILTLNRPRQHNALNGEMVAQLQTILNKWENDKSLKLLLLKANGKNFCAGADLEWMKKMAESSYEENVKDAQNLAQVLQKLYHFKKPTLAMVQGSTFGGGMGLIAACQLVLASSDANFCFSEAKLGIIPAVISPFIINAIGARQARVYFLTAHPFDAPQAKKLGLCHEVVSQEELLACAEHWIDLLLQNAPQALQAINTLLQTLSSLPIDQIRLNETAHALAKIRLGEEGQAGIRAFLEKREPPWRA